MGSKGIIFLAVVFLSASFFSCSFKKPNKEPLMAAQSEQATGKNMGLFDMLFHFKKQDNIEKHIHAIKVPILGVSRFSWT